VRDLKEKFGEEKLSIRTGFVARIDFSRALIKVDGKQFPVSAIGTAAQELIVAGGLENWVKQRL